MTILDDSAEELKKIEQTINEREKTLAADGPARLELHRQIGEQLLKAKAIARKTFDDWVTTTFNRKHEWRATHVRLAKHWNRIQQARTWAEGESHKLAVVHSVDGALELLRVWEEAHGRVTSKRKRRAAKTSDADAVKTEACEVKVSSEQELISDLKRQLAAQHDEIVPFRKDLEPEAARRALSLLQGVESGEKSVEGELRQIARDHCWLYSDLFENLRAAISGSPEKPSPAIAAPPSKPDEKLPARPANPTAFTRTTVGSPHSPAPHAAPPQREQNVRRGSSP